MIGGMYLGEILRRVLLKMAEDTGLFGSEIPERLTKPFSLLYVCSNSAIANVSMSYEMMNQTFVTHYKMVLR